LTAKDCSIMIALQRLDDDINSDVIQRLSTLVINDGLLVVSDEDEGEDSCPYRWIYSVKLTDVDMKDPSKIARLFRNDFRMIEAYQASIRQ